MSVHLTILGSLLNILATKAWKLQYGLQYDDNDEHRKYESIELTYKREVM